MSTVESIKAHDGGRSYNAWKAQVTVYGLPSDDAAFVSWWTAVEAQAKKEMAAAIAR